MRTFATDDEILAAAKEIERKRAEESPASEYSLMSGSLTTTDGGKWTFQSTRDSVVMRERGEVARLVQVFRDGDEPDVLVGVGMTRRLKFQLNLATLSVVKEAIRMWEESGVSKP